MRAASPMSPLFMASAASRNAQMSRPRRRNGVCARPIWFVKRWSKPALTEASAAVDQGGDIVLIVLGVELVILVGVVGIEQDRTDRWPWREEASDLSHHFGIVAETCRSHALAPLVPTSNLRMRDAFVLLTDLNSWSHATYFIAAGATCRSATMSRRRSARRGPGARPALEEEDEREESVDRELAMFWNTHRCVEGTVAEAHIKELAVLTPHVVLAVPSPFLLAVNEKYVVTAEASADLDTPDERALRLLLLGIMHHTLRLYAPAQCGARIAGRALQHVDRGWRAV
ncbi:hypothetical protein C8R44DRAFT_988717 [Mycena epipterygia]|nr:hypothetical protein C8R44DRAFT_988717 [Mycena epipterygia]